MKFDSLGNVCTKVTDYVANGSFKSLKENVTYEDRQNGYAALIRLADYRNQFKGPFQYIDKHGYDYLKKTKLYGNEIVISNVGAHLGTVFRVPKLHLPMSLGPNSIVISTKYNDDYYYYYLTSPVGQSLMRSIVSGSAQPKFNKTDFKKLLVPVPSLDEQNRIAGKLLTIDKKIRINRQLNANLVGLCPYNWCKF
ncbi:type I R/M system specificity subunit [Limosilactobacillus fermentum]|uniref:restriction endonuclease subunit S n=1 Tax=Limosilactobacillus fermentum TaxID=1613 RepID=UPI000E098CA9|nr:restriction endonuclease subunit S [Limosilactobacillus fermentum]RDG05324.1 type I R/M system specificity subunit [Limosilactobacillus fermentum]